MFIKDLIVRTAKNILIHFPKMVFRFFTYISDFLKYRRKNDDRLIAAWSDFHPCLKDKVKFTPFDHHYIYHPAWAARILAITKPEYHVDISSILNFSSIVSAFVPIRFYDYRPADLNLPGLQSDYADLKKLPFENNSIVSLSCMHTVEHIGLGRYGDELDPDGDLKAINELKRVLSHDGNLLFVTPVGKPKIEFNAHRIYSYEQVIEYFLPLKLKEFSLIPDKGGLIFNADPSLVKGQNYGCGCFWFKNK